MMIIRGLFLSLIPGVGQIQDGRPFRGLLFFTCFLCAVNAWLMAPFVCDEPMVSFVEIAGIVMASLIWFAACVEVLIRRATWKRSGGMLGPAKEWKIK